MTVSTKIKNPNQIESRLLTIAALFLGLYSLILTLAPAARTRSWLVDYSFTHWIGFLVWLIVFTIAHRKCYQWLPNHDPYLLPIAGLLSGWGLLEIWRLFPEFGARQTAWLVVAVGLLILGSRIGSDLRVLRRYKYLWLTAGILLTGLTLIFGTTPLGYGPRMWLGCCGVYLQPSEPLKLLLLIYLAAYMADQTPLIQSEIKKGNHRPPYASLLPLLAPTLIMVGLAMLIILIQRDLGTASIFLILYAVIVYLTTERKRVLVFSALILLVAGMVGYLMYDPVRIRIDGWINPWLDPSGRSYQIVQSLLAVANGGLLGRGAGLGNPSLVPIPHSDFIYTSISEENGLIGSIGFLLLFAILTYRGILITLHARNNFQRVLAAGLTAYISLQCILITGGNLRLLPLTGVTLPFVSYGGSSLVTSYLGLLLLMHISNNQVPQPRITINTRPYLSLAGIILFGLALVGLATGWWAFYRGPDLLTRTDNPRRAISDQFVLRGSVLDRRNEPIQTTEGDPGDYTRVTQYPGLSNIVGYSHPTYGQSGLEASMDGFLRGLEGNPGLLIWWNHLLYGQPPPGLDIRTSLDLKLQGITDQALAGHSGAAVLINAETGEILSMSSQPTFDSNILSDAWEGLIEADGSPLLNRATQGLYPPGSGLGALLLASISPDDFPPNLPDDMSIKVDGLRLDCAAPITADSWEAAIQNGCPAAVGELASSLGNEQLKSILDNSGLTSAPEIRIPVSEPTLPATNLDPVDMLFNGELRVSPLQMAQAYASISNRMGVLPALQLVSAVNTPQAGWVVLPLLAEPADAISPTRATSTSDALATDGHPLWYSIAAMPTGASADQQVSWFVGGTTAEWEGIPLVLAVAIEGDRPVQAQQIGLEILQAAINY